MPAVQEHLGKKQLIALFGGFGYGREAIYLTEITRSGIHGMGLFVPDNASRVGMTMPDLRDDFRMIATDQGEVGVSTVLMNAGYMRGHLQADPPGPLLPGWKETGWARLTADCYIQERFSDRQLQFAGFRDGARFNKIVTPGDKIEVRVSLRKESNKEVVFDAELLRGEQNVADVGGITYSPLPDFAGWPAHWVDPEALVEIGGFAIGATALGFGSVEGKVPAFIRFGSLQILHAPEARRPIEISATVSEARSRKLEGQASFRSGGVDIATLNGVYCLLREPGQ